ncbi:HEAT repeat protein-like protein [Macrophomina phaseolina]|uniref:HEAT repeat protein-like protein n=1 Tax=Macrophomina phaseolina TaxID=35725 RepID=A0ABQ8GKD4_9PEZI|nr:HEAT repeat protein-like protein [Macrophomina phaseolina]
MASAEAPPPSSSGSGSTAAPTPTPTAHETNPDLDITKLHSLSSEQQELYLLTFTADLARHSASLDADGASAHQIYIKKESFKVINLTSPAPTRVIRSNVGRALADVFAKGDRKLLFESINELVSILASSGKGDKEIKTKHAAAHCLGAIMEAAGDSAIGPSGLATMTLLRQLKANAQNHTGFRATVFRGLGKIAKGVSKLLDEQVARDVWKQARTAASGDKSSAVQAAACWCLEQLVRSTPYFDNSNDFDKLQNVIWKAIDNTSPSVRHAAASAMASLLVKSYSETPITDAVPRIKKPKKSKRQSVVQDADEEVEERPGSPAPTKPITQLAFALPGLLKQLSSHYIKTGTSNRARTGIAVCYMKIMKGLPKSVIESKYGDIARNLFNDVLSASPIVNNRYRQLMTRRFVRLILEEVVGRQILGETAQLNAAKFLLNEILKDYPPALKERPEPSKQTLTGALTALTSLMRNLGSATNSIAEICREALLGVLQHPSYTVQVHASSCLRAFVLACPQQLIPAVTICMNSVNRELGQLSGPRPSPRKCVGFANGLSAVLSTSSAQPLYGSVDVNSRVLQQATSLLKSSSSSDIRISSTQIQVAWILIGGLMTLGPNFVKIHLSQLLLLWKNALPKPLNKDSMTSRNLLDLSFLTHVRECALGSVLTFLEFNSRLLTTDVTKRLAAMLQNTTLFLNSLPAKKTTDDMSQRLSSALQLHDFDLMVRRRVLQCYTKLVNLSPAGNSEMLLQTNLLPFAVSSFADPDNYAPSSLSVSIASSASTFESIWDVSDNYGFGVTGLVQGFDLKPLAGELGESGRKHWTTKPGPEYAADAVISSPVCNAREHDSISLYIGKDLDSDELPDPPATEVVNAALNLFAILLPLQTPKVQESILEQITSFMSAGSLQRDPARKAAMTVNIAVALLGALKVANKETLSSPGDLKGQAVEKVMQEMLHTLIVDTDQYVRNVACEALGRLCANSGNTFTTAEVNFLVEQIVANREPNVRAGCAVALGSIHSQLGGMAAGFHLKNILSILMSLASDPHPSVHFWALDSLSRVADSAGLSFSGYVTSFLGLLAQLYMAESHNEEISSLASSNMEVDLPTPAVIARCVDSIINVLGPDLQDMFKARDLIMTLISQFLHESELLVLVESLRCQEHLSLYAPGHMEFEAYVKSLQKDLESPSPLIRDMAIDGLHNLMRRNAEEVIRTAKPGLEDQLWLILNQNPQHEVIRSILRNWLQQTALSNTLEWVQRCNAALTKIMKQPENKENAPPSKPRTAHTNGVPELQDEEVAGFAAASGTQNEETGGMNQTQELLNWQVRTFAMDLLSELLTTVGRDYAIKGEDSQPQAAIQAHVADVVRIAFSASTAGVVSLRLRGLRIVDQVLKTFGKTPDPDFPEATLLEQYQAQIGSALTPAFAADSSPELAAEAVNVCATFISTGIVTDVERMGRILKLLVQALENFSADTETASIGDLKGLSSNAQVMVKMAVYSAWAELQIASKEQRYLVDVLRPYIAKLTPLWLSSLREFARLRFEPDISTTAAAGSLSGSLDTIYAALNRETLLKFYQDSWLNLVDAIASLIDEDAEFVFDALDGKELDEEEQSGDGPKEKKPAADINYRDEPVAFFFVLFGLAFEALVTTGRPSSGDSQSNKEHTLEILRALKNILKPSVSGHAIYQEVVFSETMDMLDRLVLTEGLDVQEVIVEIARNLCLAHPSAQRGQRAPNVEETLSDDIEQLFELTRIMVLVLAGLVPGLGDNNTQARHALTDESVALITLALSALVDAADVFPSIIRTDLHACLLQISIQILSTPSTQTLVVPQVLPIFRRFVSTLAGTSLPETQYQLRSTLERFLMIITHAQKREFEAAPQCEKNTLLATTILLTSGAGIFDPCDPLLKRFTDLLADCLQNRVTSKVASNCCRSLLVLPKKNGDAAANTANALAKQLIPTCVSFLASPPPEDLEGLEESRTVVSLALTNFVSTLQPNQIPVAMALALPTLLARASKEGESCYKETATRLIELAGAGQESFRAVVGRLSSDQKAFMEGVVRSGGQPARKMPVRQDSQGEPTIALKMNFSS